VIFAVLFFTPVDTFVATPFVNMQPGCLFVVIILKAARLGRPAADNECQAIQSFLTFSLLPSFKSVVVIGLALKIKIYPLIAQCTCFFFNSTVLAVH